MPSPNYKELFRAAAEVDKLTLFQTLLDASELNAELALALLKTVHRHLSSGKPQTHLDYKRYAETIAALRFQRADLLKDVIDAWSMTKQAKEIEWLSDGVIK